MNRADKRAADEYLLELQNNAADIFERKQKNLVGKNHGRIEKIKKYISNEEKKNDNR